jgi:hypothetical protein
MKNLNIKTMMNNIKIKTRKTDYKSKKWLKGLEKIRKQNELMYERSKPDAEKMNIRFNI